MAETLQDHTLDILLDLDEDRYLVDDDLGLWVKFDIKRVICTLERPHGIRYSLSLHNRFNQRVMGFDNAHAIEFGAKGCATKRRIFDHWHADGSSKGKPYHYVTAAKLLEDFWFEVDRIVSHLKGRH